MQVLKASSALLKHIKTTEQESSSTTNPNLLADADEEDPDNASTSISLLLTTKKAITDTKRLKPSKLPVPHPLNTSSSTTICLITADPQRTYKDIISSPAFPPTLSSRITRVIGLSKLQAKYKQYEAQRKLFAEHDLFLADERIITQLAKALGKTFYKSTAKRPVPVSLTAPKARVKGKGGEKLGPAGPQAVAAEIEKAVQCALIHFSPSTHTAVKIGYANWSAEKLAENVEVVSNGLIEKFVPKKWRGVKALHIKGPETAALPIWLADEMWEVEEDVLEDGGAADVVVSGGKKRKVKALEKAELEEEIPAEKKAKKQKLLESNDDNLDREIALRKALLKKQKADAAKDVKDDIPKATKKSKEVKAKDEVAVGSS